MPEAFVDRGILRLFYSWKPETLPDKPWNCRYKEIRAMSIRAKDLPSRETHDLGDHRR